MDKNNSNVYINGPTGPPRLPPNFTFVFVFEMGTFCTNRDFLKTKYGQYVITLGIVQLMV